MDNDLKILTVKDIADLQHDVEGIRMYLSHLSKCFEVPKVINISGISRLMQVSRTQLLTKQAYLLPNHGRVSDFPDGPMRWRYATFEAWDARPVDERKREYELLLANEKNKARKRT